MRALIIPMSWGRGLGPLMESLAIYQALTNGGVQCALALKPTFLKNPMVKHNRPRVFSMPERPLPPVGELFYKDFAASQGLDDPEYVRSILESEAAAVKDFRPDAIISILQPSASLTARRSGIPHLSEARWTEHPRFTSPVFKRFGGSEEPQPSNATKYFNKFLKAAGLSEVHDIWDLSFMYSDVKFVPGPPEFEPELIREKGIEFLGFLQDIAAGNKDSMSRLVNTPGKSKKRILLSYLSAKALKPSEYCPIIAAALEKSPFRAIVALGGTCRYEEFEFSSSRVSVRDWIDLAVHIPTAEALVTVGTRTSALQAVLAGIGNIIIPGGDDELTFTSFRLKELGVAALIPKEDLTVEAMRMAISEATGQELRGKARMLGERMRKLGGPKRMVELVHGFRA